EGAGCRLLYLPPYSPDLNPIEQAFAKLKSHLRKHEERTQAGLERFLGECLDRVPQLSATLRISRYTNLKAALVFVW
ncbi:MAG TPA: transposase, partial [Pirellulales bacterium]